MVKAVNELSLADFANMVRMDASGTGFATSIEKTSGNIYADKSGKVHNASSMFSIAKGDATKNLMLRIQLMRAFENHHANADFMNDVRKMLGLTSNGADVTPEAKKPLSRMVVKQLLSKYNAGRQEVAGSNDPCQTRMVKGELANEWTELFDEKKEKAALSTMKGALKESLFAAQTRFRNVNAFSDKVVSYLEQAINHESNIKQLKLLGQALTEGDFETLDKFVKREMNRAMAVEDIISNQSGLPDDTKAEKMAKQINDIKLEMVEKSRDNMIY